MATRTQYTDSQYLPSKHPHPPLTNTTKPLQNPKSGRTWGIFAHSIDFARHTQTPTPQNTTTTQNVVTGLRALSKDLNPQLRHSISRPLLV